MSLAARRRTRVAQGGLYASYGLNKGDENTPSEEAQVGIRDDGGQTWGEPFTMASGRESRREPRRVPVAQGQSCGPSWARSMTGFSAPTPGPMSLDESTGIWEKRGVVVDAGFWPMQEPQKMADSGLDHGRGARGQG